MSRSDTKKNIWIDTDIIFNRIGHDVDDGLALMMALNNKDVHIAGISVQQGVDNGLEVTQKFLKHYSHYPIPVFKGSNDLNQSYGQNNEAVRHLASALNKGPLTIAGLGAATDIATLIELYPEAAKNITEIVFCAGRQHLVTFTVQNSSRALPDANFDNDTASMIRVLESGIPVTLCGYEASANVFLYWEDLNKIKKNGRDGDFWVYKRLRYWMLLWNLALCTNGFIPFDVCTIGHILYPEYFSYHRQIPVQVSVRKNDAPRWKKGKEKEYLDVSYKFDSHIKVDFIYTTKKTNDTDYKKIIMNKLLGN